MSRPILLLVILVLTACEQGTSSTELASFDMTVAAGTTTGGRGQTASLDVLLGRHNFKGAINFSATGLPTGVIASFPAAPADRDTATIAMTLTIAATVEQGTYPFVVHASGEGVPERTANASLVVTSGHTLALSVETVTLDQGGSVTTPVVVSRLGGLTGSVTLALEDIPVGITAAVSSQPGSGNDGSIQLTSNALTPVGNYTLRVRGTSASGATSTSVLSIKVNSGISATTTELTANASQGGNTELTLTLRRAAGFQLPVSFTNAGFPAGVTVVADPLTATGTTSHVSIGIPSTVPAGEFLGTITPVSDAGTGPPVTVRLSVTSNGIGTSVRWKFCSGTRPSFFAYQSGTGAWQLAAAGSDNNYYMLFTAANGAVAYGGVPGGAGTMFIGTTGEISAAGTCAATTAAGSKSASGSMSGNITAANGVLGPVALTVSLNPANVFTANNLPDAPLDLVMTAGLESDVRTIIRRALTVSNGGVIPMLNFSSSEAVVNTPRTLTLTGTAGHAWNTVARFQTSTSRVLNASTTFRSIGASQTIRPVPATGVPGDLHSLVINALDQPANSPPIQTLSVASDRTLTAWFDAIDDMTLDAGPEVAAPTFTLTSVGAKQQLTISGVPSSEFDDRIILTVSQPGVPLNFTITVSGSAIAGNQYRVVLPDLSGLSGAPGTSANAAAQVAYSINAAGKLRGAVNDVPVAGSTQRSALRKGNATISP